MSTSETHVLAAQYLVELKKENMNLFLEQRNTSLMHNHLIFMYIFFTILKTVF